jgi:hypothetical protein
MEQIKYHIDYPVINIELVEVVHKDIEKQNQVEKNPSEDQKVLLDNHN